MSRRDLLRVSTSDYTRVSEEMKGFQAGWLKNPDGTQGKRWFLVTCGIGCACSPGCDGCPANKLAQEGKAKPVRCLTEHLLDPFGWGTPQTIFVCPEGDPLHKDVPDEFLYQIFAVMESCPHHRFVFLTKRDERLVELLTDVRFPTRVREAGIALLGERYQDRGCKWGDNVVIGVSVENQKYMKRSLILTRLPKTMTKVIFVAPMLEPVSLLKEVIPSTDWVVCSGERGSTLCKPRPCKKEWQLDLRNQCREAKIPFFLLRRYHPSWVAEFGGKCMEFPTLLQA